MQEIIAKAQKAQQDNPQKHDVQLALFADDRSLNGWARIIELSGENRNQEE
jgi:hypothetical protein